MIHAIKKVSSAARGLLLLNKQLSVFDTSILLNKRVAIIGPASSAFENDNGEYIDSFDFIVRVNKSGLIVDQHKYDIKIGSRTDILFHSFFENELTGGGKLDVEMFNKQGVKYLVNPRNNFKGLRNTLNFYKKYLVEYKTYTLSKQLYSSISAYTPNYKPTIGFTALSALLMSDFDELFISGFTFYKTPFGDGYRDELKSPDKILKSIREAGIHDVELEYAGFRELLESNKHKNILMDKQLRDILKSNS